MLNYVKRRVFKLSQKILDWEVTCFRWCKPRSFSKFQRITSTLLYNTVYTVINQTFATEVRRILKHPQPTCTDVPVVALGRRRAAEHAVVTAFSAYCWRALVHRRVLRCFPTTGLWYQTGEFHDCQQCSVHCSGSAADKLADWVYKHNSHFSKLGDAMIMRKWPKFF